MLRDRRCYRIARIGIYGQNYDNGEGFEPFKGIWGRFYIDGNYMFGNADVTADNWTDGVYAYSVTFESGAAEDTAEDVIMAVY